jgi:uridine kinase
MVDWDHPDSWHGERAVAALEDLCSTGRVDVPSYSIPHNAARGHRVLDLAGEALFVAEGIFAAEVVPGCEERGLLAAAYCVRQHPVLTFWRRLTRDLRERRKPPLVLLRRGVALLRDQRRVVAHAVSRGCTPVTPDEAAAQVLALR